MQCLSSVPGLRKMLRDLTWLWVPLLEVTSTLLLRIQSLLKQPGQI